jgi:hypothetical protein
VNVLKRYQKSLLTLAGAVVAWLTTAAAVGGISTVEWWGLAAAVAGVLTVAAVKNEPVGVARVRKAIASVLAVLATWGVTAFVDGAVTHDEWVGLVVLVATTLGVYHAPREGSAYQGTDANRAVA